MSNVPCQVACSGCSYSSVSGLLTGGNNCCSVRLAMIGDIIIMILLLIFQINSVLNEGYLYYR